MPSKNAILMGLALADLQAAATRFKVAVQDRRRKDSLVTGLLSDKAMAFSTLLGAMPAASLQGLCEDLAVTPSGRGKAAAVQALDAAVPARKARATPSASKASAKKAAPAPKAAKPGTKGAKSTKKGVAAAASPTTPAAKTAAAEAPVKAVAKSRAKPAAKAAALSATDRSAPAKPTKKAPRKPVAEPVQATPAVQEPEPAAEPPVAAPPAAEPAKKPPARRGPLSWSEAAQMAEHRGQSAASMLRAPVPQTTGSHSHTCTKCKGSVTLQACQVQACNNYYVAEPGRKICAECLFERNTISMDDFNDRLQEERRCSHCSAPLTHLSSGSHA